MNYCKNFRLDWNDHIFPTEDIFHHKLKYKYLTKFRIKIARKWLAWKQDRKSWLTILLNVFVKSLLVLITLTPDCVIVGLTAMSLCSHEQHVDRG